MSKKGAVKISRELVDEIQRRVDESGGEFQVVEAYIEFVLRAPQRRRARTGLHAWGRGGDQGEATKAGIHTINITT